MKTSDLTLSIVIIIIFILLYVFSFFVVGLSQIKDNWPLYRCNPLIMPFAGSFGYDPKVNFAYCIKSMQTTFMEPILKPLNFNMSSLGDIASGLTKNLADNRVMTNFMRGSVINSFTSIFNIVQNAIVEVQRVFINMKDLIGKLIGIMVSVLYILSGSIMTMNSAWSGPPGQLVRALCFHPETKVKLQNGEILQFKDIPLNSILANGTKVYALMQISNLAEDGSFIEKLYRIKNDVDVDSDILVSGSHLVYDPSNKYFVHVKDLSEAIQSDINCDTLHCLITSDHTIPIGQWIFHDWEDNNGSMSKKIG